MLSEVDVMALKRLTCVVCTFLPLALGAGSAVRADVVYGNIAVDSYWWTLMDLDSDGQGDFAFPLWTRGGAPNPDMTPVRFSVSVRQVPLDLGSASWNNGITIRNGAPIPLMHGALIGPSPGEGEWLDAFDEQQISERVPLPVDMCPIDAECGRWIGPWAAIDDHYLGVRFAALDGIHYGWIRVHVPLELLASGVSYFGHTAPFPVDWAYESTPNTPITAGVVPEPATWLLLVAAAAILAGWKMRRRVLPFLLCVFIPVAANGEIIHRTAARPGSWEPFDLDGNGQLDFRFGVKTLSPDPLHLSIYFAIERAGGAAAGNGVLTDPGGVLAVAPGYLIGPDADGLAWDDGFFDREIPGVSAADALLGFPPLPHTQLIGLRLRSEDGLHYGWVRLAQNYWAPYDTAHPDWPPELDPRAWYGNAIHLPRFDTYNPGVIDWAYESTPHTPIVAGAVPEPGGIALILIANVLSLIIACRRFLSDPGASTWRCRTGGD